MQCSKCGKNVGGNVGVCFKCKMTEARDEGFALGLQQGSFVGERNARKAFITVERWRQLVSLCHPDKHNGSQTANDVTAWLGTVKPE